MARSTQTRGLNITRARGKWYVYTRDTHKCLVRGFIGGRDDIEQHVANNLDSLLAAATENEKLKDDRARASRARHRTFAAIQLHKTTEKRCRQKGIYFDLSIDDIHDILFHAGDECEVSRLPFDYGEKEVTREWHKNPFLPSLDRVDRGMGYSRCNVRVVCTSVNIGINEWGLAHFLKICLSVASRDPEIVLQTDRFQSNFMAR